MGPGIELQRWAARLCAGLVVALTWMGYYFANVRFAPMVAGFAILAAVLYSGRLLAAPTRPLGNSGRHRAL
jgi:hypothetical protein